MHKYLSYSVIPYVEGCIAHESLSGTDTTPDVMVQQPAPEHAALIFSVGKKVINKINVNNILFILKT